MAYYGMELGRHTMTGIRSTRRPKRRRQWAVGMSFDVVGTWIACFSGVRASAGSGLNKRLRPPMGTWSLEAPFGFCGRTESGAKVRLSENAKTKALRARREGVTKRLVASSPAGDEVKRTSRKAVWLAELVSTKALSRRKIQNVQALSIHLSSWYLQNRWQQGADAHFGNATAIAVKQQVRS